MAEYIYFCTSLPMLCYGATPPFSSQEFLRSAAGNLSVANFKVLGQLDFSRASERVTDSEFLAEYYIWEVALRNQVLLQRLKILEQHAAKPHSGALGSVMLALAVEQILQQGPLAIEHGLDRLRWNKLEELCGARLFDMVFLAVYFLKLKILERAASWQQDIGKERYENVVKETVEEVGVV